ncbi:MAG: dTDP-N-acetylfucosamine:lipid II N-acetylfucosaminyltransferase [Paraglaciecola sp.]|jgi:hypothetical protein
MKVAHVSHFHKHVENIEQLFSGIPTECIDVFLYQIKDQDLNNKMLLAMFDVCISRAKLFNNDNKHEIVNQLLHYDVLVFHSLSKISIELINKLDDFKGSIVWLGWGYDYTELMFDKFEDMLDGASLHAYKKLKQNNQASLIGVTQQKQKAISRISVFSPVLYDEFLIVRERNDFCAHLVYADLMYGFKFPMSEIASLGRSVHKTKTIWLGNSATISNNHLDYFQKINGNKQAEYTHKLPVSYGFENYRNYLKSELEKYKLTCQIDFIDNFQEFEEYCKSIAECKVMVMNHIRQQALGNIFIGLLVGCIVFIHYKSPAFTFFKRNGFFVYSIEELNSIDLIEKSFFSSKFDSMNREKVLAMFSLDSVSYRAEALFKHFN